MDRKILTCDCGLEHAEVIGMVEIKLNGMVINARWDACKPLIESLLPFLIRADNTNDTVVKAVTKMEAINASSVAPDVPSDPPGEEEIKV